MSRSGLTGLGVALAVVGLVLGGWAMRAYKEAEAVGEFTSVLTGGSLSGAGSAGAAAGMQAAFGPGIAATLCIVAGLVLLLAAVIRKPATQAS